MTPSEWEVAPKSKYDIMGTVGEQQPLIRSSGSFPPRKRSREFCCAVIQSEFKCHNLLLDHPREDIFYSCQWDWSPIIFVLYRLAAAGYAFSVLILSILYYDSRRWKNFPWPVWLTNWSFFLLTAHLLLAALITLLYSCERGRCCHRCSVRSSVYSFLPDGDMEDNYTIPPMTMPWYIKLDWLLYNLASVSAIIVTVVFFSALYPVLNPRGGMVWGDITHHISNSLLVLLDVSLCAIPVRLLHGFYCIIYGTCYLIFSVIYWYFDHNNILYPKILDWNNPLPTIGFVVLLLAVVVPFLQLILFGLYRLRIYVYKCVYMKY